MHCCRRIPARFGAAVLAAALSLLAAASGAEAATNPVDITVQAGYHGVVKTGDWMPVTIDVTNGGPDVEGSLEVQASSNGQGGPPQGTAVYQTPLSLASGATKHFRTYVAEDYAGVTVTARVVQNGRVLATKDAPTANMVTALIGVVSDQPTALDNFAAVHPGGIAAAVVHLSSEEISNSALMLRAFDLLVVDDYATDTLTQGQRTALADFVMGGGSLLIGTGSTWHKTLAGLPPAVLPMQVTGSSTLTSSLAIDGFTGAEVATGTLTGGHAWLSEGGLPLLVEQTIGTGTVTMATFDWNQEPVAGAAGTEPLLRQVLARAVYGSVAARSVGIGTAPIGQRGNALVSVLGNLPALDLPSLQLTAALVLIYVLLVGPVNYLVLRAMRRQALAWITVPLIAVIASGAAYGGSILTKGRSVQTNQIAIVHLDPGWDRAYLETYAGVLTPTRGDYQVRIGGDPVLISPISTYNGGFPGVVPNGSADAITVDSQRATVELPAMTAFTLRGFATEGVTAAPRLTGRVRLVNGSLTGTVQNLSTTSFTDAVLIAGDGFQLLGPLKPGATATINLVPKVSSGLGSPPAWSNIYTNTSFGPTTNQTTAADRDAQTKTQILYTLPTGAGFKGMTSTVAPLLVAWTRQSFQDITVNGNRARATVLSAVALTIFIDQVGAGVVPAGVINGRIVDVEGNSQGGPPGGLMMTTGSVTFEFTPGLAAGMRLTGTSLAATNPFGKGGALSGQVQNGSVQGEVWDWSRSKWVQVAYQDNGTTALPEWAAAPTTGQVRLRVKSSNGQFFTGGISLTGTVQ